MNKILYAVLFVFLISPGVYSQDLVKYVDPFIGTGGHGHTYPGATLPFGMVQVSPDTRVGNWDACGGYHYSDKSILGFSHLHLSGTGCLDYGDILFMPSSGEIQLQPGDENNTLTGYRGKFSHSSEIAQPGYYSVMLEDDSIKAELTATERVAFHRYTYSKGRQANLIIDLTHQLETKEIIKESEFIIIDGRRIQGKRRSQGWAEDQIIYFAAELSSPIVESGIENNTGLSVNLKQAEGNKVKAYLKFDLKDGEPLLIKVAVSSVDYEGAWKNLAAEIPGWDFDKTKSNAHDIWNKQLSKIIIKEKSPEKLTVFYTALYHTMIVPNIFFDTDRRYRGNDGKIHTNPGFDNYTVFSLWDTYRSTHPLYLILEPGRAGNMIKSLLSKYDESGMLPKWELAGNETNAMTGYHAVSVIADAWVKGIRDFDPEKALSAMVNSAYNSSPEMKMYKQNGYIPGDIRLESVSKTLEYSYDDWAIYIMAKNTGNTKIADEFLQRAKNYNSLFDGSSGFFRGRTANGGWVPEFNHDGIYIPGFDPLEISRNYTEGNAWQYSLLVPHDIYGLVNLYGSEERFAAHLDSLFTVELPAARRTSLDVSGLIGQYAHGNEPGHHSVYIYNFIHQPWKAQEKLHRIFNEMYTAQPDGLAGNEDCGQMSSWYIFSTMGFYPFCPGTDEYQLGAPYFQDVTINLPDGKTFIVKAENLSDENFYVQSVFLNGKQITSSFIRHSDIINGGELVFKMGSTPNKFQSKNEFKTAYTLTTGKVVSTPFIKNSGYIVRESEIELECLTGDAVIRYTIDGSEPGPGSSIYKDKFKLPKDVFLKYRAYKEGCEPSRTVSLYTGYEKAAGITKDSLINGVEYNYCEGLFFSAYDVQKVKFTKTGVLNDILLEPAERKDMFGFVFNGYIYIPEEDVYTFYTRSDDGSILLIDNREVVNNDGGHSDARAKNNLVALCKGYHSFTILYFDKNEDNVLEAGWSSSRIPRQPLPAEYLFRKK